MQSTIENYTPLALIGKGSIATVLLVQEKSTQQQYVMKVIMKSDLRQKIGDLKIRLKLEKFSHPFVLEFKNYFQTNNAIIFITKFMRGGDLFFQLQSVKRFHETRAQFYFCEIALALSYLHEKQLVYRDLKPENILLDEDGHIVLTDFGLTRYEMIVGIPPFYNQNQNVMFQLILDATLQFPKSIEITSECQDFITKLLNKDSKQRLGAQTGIEELKQHSWMKIINWDNYYEKQAKPIFLPNCTGSALQNFDKEITESKYSEFFEKLA